MRKFDLDHVDPDPEIGDWGWAQRPYISEIERQYNEGKPVRIIVLKARQLGISTATEAVLFLWAFLHPGTNGLVLSYEDGQAQELFRMTQTYWETWPHKALYNLKYGTRRQLQWEETKSQVRVATAKNVGGARGSTVHALHASEVAFWSDPATLWTGLNQTIPQRHGTLVALESTANGVGNWFHEMWLQAESGESDFVPMFFPWFRHPAYRARNSLHTIDLDTDERHLYRLMVTAAGDTVDTAAMTDDEAMAALSWRRWAIPRKVPDLNAFHQEYPSTPEEAFLTTGNPIFAHSTIKDCYDPKRGAHGRFYRNAQGRTVFEQDETGPWTVFRRPSADVRPDKYFLAGDPSETVVGDPSCIQVLNRQTFEQVAVYHARVNPMDFARQMMLAGDFYHHAMLCPEVEGGGQAAIGAILQAGYDNVWRYKVPDRRNESINTFGWSTNYQRKQWAIGELQKLLMDRSLLIHDKTTYVELCNYVQREDGTLGNASSATHDDTVMALAIAVTASRREGIYQPYANITPEPLDIYSTEVDNVDNVVSIFERMR
jgi:hypothetical protein